jgi:hypothetical protein
VENGVKQYGSIINESDEACGQLRGISIEKDNIKELI